MAIDSASPRSRRALLGAALGAGIATAVAAIGRPSEVRAGSDGDVVLGSDANAASSITKITNSSNAADVLWGASTTYGTGVLGTSDTGIGVMGNSLSGGTGVEGVTTSGFGVYGAAGSGWGIYGYSSAGIGARGQSSATDQPAAVGKSNGSSTGVLGFSGAELDTLPAAPAKTGVYGRASQDSNARGVYGQTTAGRGVYGQATSGAGVYGYSTSGAGLQGSTATGYALRTSGRLRMDKASGVATIFAGNTVQVVTPGLDVTGSSFVLLTPKGDLGTRRLWYTTDTTNDRFTIRVSSAITTDLKVGWLLIG